MTEAINDASKRHAITPLAFDEAMLLATPALIVQQLDGLVAPSALGLGYQNDALVVVQGADTPASDINAVVCALQYTGPVMQRLLPPWHVAALAARCSEPSFASASPAELLAHCTSLGASDVHIEPEADAYRLRVRVDGVLRGLDVVPSEQGRKLVEAIKVMARIDTATVGEPCDGVHRAHVAARHVEYRISTIPTQHGDALVARILDKVLRKPSLQAMFADRATSELLSALAREPAGLIVVVGPTGSGKSTTLHALLALVNDGQRAILSLEDPVEHSVNGVRQSSLGGRQSMAPLLRAMLRQDPDVLMVGEVRDRDTAVVSLDAARTGHLVFTTLHCGSASQVPQRFAELGAPPAAVQDCLRAVVSQRLLRRLCVHCQGDGCARCAQTGYNGRLAVAEVVDANGQMLGASMLDTTNELIVQGLSDARERDRVFGHGD